MSARKTRAQVEYPKRGLRLDFAAIQKHFQFTLDRLFAASAVLEREKRCVLFLRKLEVL